MKLIFGIWHPTKTWHIVHVIKYKEHSFTNYYATCNKTLWVSCGTTFLHYYADCEPDEYLNLNNICKHCIKKVDIEKIKTYIIYHKLGIKQ